MFGRTRTTPATPAAPAAPAPRRAAVADLRRGYLTPRVYDQRPHDHSADSQSTQRERRRAGLPVVYGPAFSLSEELAALLGDVLLKIAMDPRPERWAGPVLSMLRRGPGEKFDSARPGSLADALAPIAEAVRAAVPVMPEVDESAVVGGSWVSAVLECVRHLDGPLSYELGRPHRLVDGEPIGAWLAGQLREVDRAVRALTGQIGRWNVTDATPPPSAEGRAVNALRARHAAEVAALRDRHAAEMSEFAAARRGA